LEAARKLAAQSNKLSVNRHPANYATIFKARLAVAVVLYHANANAATNCTF
jgi:hypothetical protein